MCVQILQRPYPSMPLSLTPRSNIMQTLAVINIANRAFVVVKCIAIDQSFMVTLSAPFNISCIQISTLPVPLT